MGHHRGLANEGYLRTRRTRLAPSAVYPRLVALPIVEETSAGGLVLDGDHRAALIGRRNARGVVLWSLPKGHIEEGESAEGAAIREVGEETGIVGRVVAPLGVIDFTFTGSDSRIHKTVHHFLMFAEGGELTDDDAEIDEVAWVPFAELHDRLSYADERELLSRVPELLASAS